MDAAAAGDGRAPVVDAAAAGDGRAPVVDAAAAGDGRAPVVESARPRAQRHYDNDESLRAVTSGLPGFKLCILLCSLCRANGLPSPPYNPGVRALIQRKRAASLSLPQKDVESGFLGWHESGYLPHRDEPGLIQFVTFRLADALPTELRSEWEALFKIEDDRKRRIELERYLDKGRGACHLKRPDLAAIVEASLLFRHDVQYELRAWVIMPNHVHVLFRVQSVPMSRLVEAWKGYTAKEADKLLHRKGQFWQEDYWDTFMRGEEHELKTRRYIENNPTKAKLTAFRKDWPWSSARFRDSYERLCFPH